MKKTCLLISFIIFSFGQIAFCQNNNDVVTNVISKLKTLVNDNITEKVYLHLDHQYPYYAAGESIYFKAYVTMGELHQPSTISQILHVDLIDKNDAVINAISLMLNNGSGWGDFNLPEKLQKGSYRIRAYTDWMRNEKQPDFFDKYISISSFNNADRVTESAKSGNKPSLQFFPEGGSLVMGLQSKVAFKAIGSDGLSINFKGAVIDNNNQEIAKITPSHLGMGEFDLLPEPGKSYKAKITFADGSQNVVDLPIAEQKGITLAVDNSNPNKISIEINANAPYFKENLNKELNLIIYGGGVTRTVKTKLDNRVLGLDLPSNNFRTGVLQVTLLSQTGEPLNERLAFVQNNDLLNLGITTNKQQFAKRESVSLNLTAKNKDGNAVNGSFSVSVIDESKILVDEESESSILSYLLLTTELKGYIEKPNYYFANVTSETRRNLDILMLSQGYRRFNWKQLLNDNNDLNAAATFKPEKTFKLSGEIKTKSGTPLANEAITLISKADAQTLIGTTDAEGKFEFKDLFFETGTRFILKTQSGTNAVLTIDKPVAGPAVLPGNPIEARYNASADLLMSLQNTQKDGPVTASTSGAPLLLQEDKSLKTVNKKDNYRSSNLGGSGHADQVITRDQIKTYPTLSMALNGVARGVQFTSGVPYIPSSATISVGGISLEPMLIVVDGTTLGSGISVDSYNPNEIETVEILKGNNASIYGIQGAAGVMVLTSRQGEERTQDNTVTREMSPGMFSITPAGLYKAKEFYSPVYNASQATSDVPDHRITIFWKPDVNTDADGNASFNFYNADGTGTYRVVVEGIDKKGNLGRQVFHYKVQ